MSKSLSILCVALALASGCGPAVKKPSATSANAKVGSRAAADKQAVTAQKPAAPTTTSTAPKPLPAPVTAGATTVKAAHPTMGGRGGFGRLCRRRLRRVRCGVDLRGAAGVSSVRRAEQAAHAHVEA